MDWHSSHRLRRGRTLGDCRLQDPHQPSVRIQSECKFTSAQLRKLLTAGSACTHTDGGHWDARDANKRCQLVSHSIVALSRSVAEVSQKLPEAHPHNTGRRCCRRYPAATEASDLRLRRWSSTAVQLPYETAESKGDEFMRGVEITERTGLFASKWSRVSVEF